MSLSTDDWVRLGEIREEMIDLLEEVKGIMREVPSPAYHRAKAYWMAQLEMALRNDHGYIGNAGCSMEDTIEDVQPNDFEHCSVCGDEHSEEELSECPECEELFCDLCRVADVKGCTSHIAE